MEHTFDTALQSLFDSYDEREERISLKAEENLMFEIDMCRRRVAGEGNPMTIQEAMKHIGTTIDHVQSERFRAYCGGDRPDYFVV